MKITVLTENTACRPDVLSEHGLSLYIETDRCNILFDMGQTDLLLQNAKVLGVDLSAVDIAVLSHGHYDHGGGVGAFRRVNVTAPLYVNRHAFGAFYSDKYIGLSSQVKGDPHLIAVDGILSLGKGITLYADGAVPLFAEQNAGLTQEIDGVRVPDDFRHEQYLLVEENGKRVLFSGCSHRGVVNIARRFSPDVLVGGFHFKNLDVEKDREYLRDAARVLSGQKAVYYTCHCTGQAQYAFLKDMVGERLRYLSCGESVEI